MFEPEPWSYEDVPEPPVAVAQDDHPSASFKCLPGGKHRRIYRFAYLMSHWIAALDAEAAAEEARKAEEAKEPKEAEEAEEEGM